VQLRDVKGAPQYCNNQHAAVQPLPVLTEEGFQLQRAPAEHAPPDTLGWLVESKNVIYWLD
jgi:hypothetical protein